MTLKKIKTIDIFLIFALCFITHFLYTWFPSTLFSIFFPVNESIWEHMKMLFTTIIIISLFDYVVFQKANLKVNNFLANIFLSSILSIIIYLIIYLPIYNQIGENMILNITILFITIYFTQIISYQILSSRHLHYMGYIGFIGIIICYIGFAILTYMPPNNDLFLDKQNDKYGINLYVV